jgi:hypothetical protein
MAETSRFFSDKFIELNDLYVEIFAMWRQIWIYNIPGPEEKNIIGSINEIELYMNRCWQYTGTTDNSLPYRALINICDSMVQACSLMRLQHDKRSSTALKKKARSYQVRALSIKYQFENYKGPDELTIPDEYVIERELEEATQ